MGTLMKYRPGVNEDEIVRLCEALDEMYREHESLDRKATSDWDEWGDLRKAALNHRGQP